MNFKPSRKPDYLILSDEEYLRKKNNKEFSSKILAKKTLRSRFSELETTNTVLEAFANIKSFSFKNYGDYVCSVLKTNLVSDENGRVSDILLTVPPYYDPNSPNILVNPMDKRHLISLIRLMFNADNNRHFTMLCHSYQLEEVENWFDEIGIENSRFSLNISVFDYSIWAQDAYVALKDENNNTIICEGVLFPRADDHSIADDISAQTSNSTYQSYLFFQGGNILEIGDYVFIGKDYIIENLGRAHLETEKKVLDAFENLLGKPVISVGRDELIEEGHRRYLGGGYFQPIFHIDMYITPTGKKNHLDKDIILVGSPKLGRLAIGEVSKPNDFDIYFDEVETQLSNYFEVRRIPILPSYIHHLIRNDKGDIVREVKRYYYLSFNNAIVENYEEESNVYLPSFSQDVQWYLNNPDVIEYQGEINQRVSLDNAAKKVWEDLEFKVHQMDGLEDLAIGWGSVHCITKTLSRSSAEHLV
ncbi:hypothetical protein Q4Q35_09395 [Flavivirga aquimarina]|uniref:Arginine deiminase n=1 Tax=Flavivirga aquimarina TaxID=2027862 RepID=A0ABT8WA55_9FLAO|nr:hypothetical protein [Flavivirga aquimarina]MDO5970023.1 hypothetical protein [Flavivirga aquimarina]